MTFDDNGLLPGRYGHIKGIGHRRVVSITFDHLQDGIAIRKDQRVTAIVGDMFDFVVEDQYAPFGLDPDKPGKLVIDSLPESRSHYESIVGMLDDVKVFGVGRPHVVRQQFKVFFDVTFTTGLPA